MDRFAGVFTALVTPFKEGELDFESLKNLVRHQMDGGVQGLVVNGTTGESPTLSQEEKIKVFELVKSEVAGQVPLIVGTGSNNTATTIETTKVFEKLGADGALAVVPYYNKPPQEGLVQHFRAVAENTALPVILYNVPGRTVTSMSSESVKTLSKISNVIGIKEASGDIDLGQAISRACGSEFLVTSGDDASFVELIGVGGKGVISVVSNIAPRATAAVCEMARKNVEDGRKEFQKIQKLVDVLGVETNPIAIKAALHAKGIIEANSFRLPLVSAAKDNYLKIQETLQDMGELL